MSEPLHVTPTKTPSMAVLVDGNRLELKDASHFHNRTDVIYRRLFYVEEPQNEGDALPFLHGLQVISYPDPPRSFVVEGWEAIAKIRVMAGQSVIVHGCIASLVSDGYAPPVSPQPKPMVQLVLYDSGQICTALVDNMNLAMKRAQAVGGVIVELPILKDYRAEKQ